MPNSPYGRSEESRDVVVDNHLETEEEIRHRPSCAPCAPFAAPRKDSVDRKGKKSLERKQDRNWRKNRGKPSQGPHGNKSCANEFGETTAQGPQQEEGGVFSTHTGEYLHPAGEGTAPFIGPLGKKSAAPFAKRTIPPDVRGNKSYRREKVLRPGVARNPRKQKTRLSTVMIKKEKIKKINDSVSDRRPAFHDERTGVGKKSCEMVGRLLGMLTWIEGYCPSVV